MSNHFTPTRGVGKMERSASRRMERRLERYRSSRAEGIQPTGTTQRQIDAALRSSDDAGQAFRADAAARAWEGTA